MDETTQPTIKSRWRLILAAALRGLIRSAVLGAAAVTPGLVLMAWSPLLGTIWLLASSFAVMAWTYRRPWRMTWVSCLVPALAAIASFVIQWDIVGGWQEAAVSAVAIAMGAVVGVYAGRTHRIAAEGQAIYARRTLGYLVVWIVSYGFTPVVVLAGHADLTKTGRAAGGFTTAMLATVSAVLLIRFAIARGRTRAGLATTACALILGLTAAAPAEQAASRVLDGLIRQSDIDISADRTEVTTPQFTDASARRDYFYTWNNKHGLAKPRTAVVHVTVDRFSSARACRDHGRDTLAQLRSGANRGDSNPTRQQYDSNITVLDHGDVSFAWQSVTADSTLHQTGPTCSAAAYAGRWRIVVHVNNVRPTLGKLGYAMPVEERNVHALKLLGIAYGRLRAMGLGDERDPASGSPAAGLSHGSGRQDDRATAAVLVSAILVAAGIMVNVANAVAAAVAESARPATDPSTRAIPPPLPPLIDPYSGQPMTTNDQGQYWDPVSGRWVSRSEAQVIQAQLDAEWAARNRERNAALQEHQRQADRDWEDARRRVREEAAAEAREKIAIVPMQAPALQEHTEDTFRDSLSEAWADHEQSHLPEFPIGDYSSTPARLVSAVDEFNRQKARLGGLDDLQEQAIRDLVRVREAIGDAEAQGNQREVEYLTGQRQIALENMRRVNDARINAAERMAKAGDRIHERGVAVTIEIGMRAPLDVSSGARVITGGGRMTSNLLDQRRRGNLPWQRTSVRMGDPEAAARHARLNAGRAARTCRGPPGVFRGSARTPMTLCSRRATMVCWSFGTTRHADWEDPTPTPPR